MALRLTQPDERVVIADVDLVVYDDQLKDVDDGVTYTVQRITPSEVAQIRRPYVKRQFSRRPTRPEELPIEGDEARQMTDDLLDRVLVAWTGVVVNGQPAPCDRAHKALLDFRRKGALIQASMASQVEREAGRKESFRATEGVGPVVD